MAAVRAASRERLAQQEAEESRSKESLVKNAASYLEKFYQVGAGPPLNAVYHESGTRAGTSKSCRLLLVLMFLCCIWHLQQQQACLSC